MLLQIENILPERKIAQLVDNSKFKQKGSLRTGQPLVTQEAQWIQLRLLYNAQLMAVKINGKSVLYYPTVRTSATPIKEKALTALRLVQDSYQVSTEFIGYIWANWISWIS